MFKSMTAFGRERADVGGKDITVEIKSVNNRYFDCSVKLPHIYAPLEQRIKQRLSEKGISRGPKRPSLRQADIGLSLGNN